MDIEIRCCKAGKWQAMKINPELVVRVQRHDEVTTATQVPVVCDGAHDHQLENNMTWVCSGCEDEIDAEVKKEDIGDRQTPPGRIREDQKAKDRSVRDVDRGRHPSLRGGTPVSPRSSLVPCAHGTRGASSTRPNSWRSARWSASRPHTS